MAAAARQDSGLAGSRRCAGTEPELHWRADIGRVLSDWRYQCLRQDMETKKFLRRMLPLNEADIKGCAAEVHRTKGSVHRT